MKLRHALLTLAACGISVPAFADVSLDLPYQAELILINGVKKDVKSPLTLPNGENQIAFRYEDSVRENGDDNFFSSDIVIVKFNATDEKLTLSLPKLRTSSDARKFNQSPELTLTNEAGKVIDTQKDKLMKSGLQFGRNYESEMAAYNAAGKIASVSTLAASTTAPVTATMATTAPASSTVSSNQQGASVAENMLNYWYEQADAETRARFKARINQQ